MRKRGYALILALFVGIILLLLGLGYLNKRITQYRGAFQTTYQTQALELARAGMEDARVKLDKDWDYPPEGGDDQKEFSYTVELTPGQESYTVLVDLSLREPPYRIYRVTAIGTSGPMTQPRARRKITAELDLSPELRSTPGVPNPQHFEWVNWQDLGSL